MISLPQTFIARDPRTASKFEHFRFYGKEKKRKKQALPGRNFRWKPVQLSAMPAEQTNNAARQSSIPLILTSGTSDRINPLLFVRALKSLSVIVNAFIFLLLAPFHASRGRHSSAKSSIACEKLRDDKHDNSRKSAVVRSPVKIFPWWNTLPTVTIEQDVAARRNVAIRRVVQENDENTFRDFSLLPSSGGDAIFTQSWTPVSSRIRGLVVILHGLNEHSGRYSYFAKKLNANGYKVYGMDWIGHGGSDGLHAYVHSLDDAVADMKTFLDKVVAENPDLPCFCFGHSTGAAIALKAGLDPKVEACVSGLVLTSPAVGVEPSHPIFAALAPLAAVLVPRYQVSAANKRESVVSRDPEALLAKYSDPLVYTGAIRVKTGYEILRIAGYLQQRLSSLRAPFLVLHGSADTITDPRASEKLYAEASSADKTIRLFDGLLHDLLIEPEREEVIAYIIEWLNCRLREKGEC